MMLNDYVGAFFKINATGRYFLVLVVSAFCYTCLFNFHHF